VVVLVICNHIGRLLADHGHFSLTRGVARVMAGALQRRLHCRSGRHGIPGRIAGYAPYSSPTDSTVVT
jgi:hypothetical protein